MVTAHGDSVPRHATCTFADAELQQVSKHAEQSTCALVLGLNVFSEPSSPWFALISLVYLPQSTVSV